jgi:hypothetical protein
MFTVRSKSGLSISFTVSDEKRPYWGAFASCKQREVVGALVNFLKEEAMENG